MICKDCLHYEVCGGYIPTDLDKDIWHYCAQGKQDEIPDIEERCSSFKLKSRCIELPCAVGELVYQIKYCRCSNPDCYEQRHCWKKETKATPKCLGFIMKLQRGKKLFCDGIGNIKWQYKPIGTICYKIYQKSFDLKMLAEIGKTVYLTEEEAKAALNLFGVADEKEEFLIERSEEK